MSHPKLTRLGHLRCPGTHDWDPKYDPSFFASCVRKNSNTLCMIRYKRKSTLSFEGVYLQFKWSLSYKINSIPSEQAIKNSSSIEGEFKLKHTILHDILKPCVRIRERFIKVSCSILSIFRFDLSFSSKGKHYTSRLIDSPRFDLGKPPSTNLFFIILCVGNWFRSYMWRIRQSKWWQSNSNFDTMKSIRVGHFTPPSPKNFWQPFDSRFCVPS